MVRFHPGCRILFGLAASLAFGLSHALALAGPDPISAPAGFGSSQFTPFIFVHASDPHLSGPGPLERFRQVGARATAAAVPFVLLSGDLGVYTDPTDYSLYGGALSAFAMPVRPIPGNHDVTTAPATLAAWRAHFANDYYSFVYNNCAFICLNSILMVEKTTYPAEYNQQWTWLGQALAAARAAGRERIIIQIHHPPYLVYETEKADYYALPPPERDRLLELCRAWGVDAVLAGHAHRNYNYTSVYPRIHILAGSWDNFHGAINGGIGFNFFRVTSRGLDRVYVRLDAPPDTTAPSAPNPLAATGRTASAVTLAWPHPPYDEGVLKYRILRDGAPHAEAVDESFTDAGLAPGESHRYAVQALDAAGNASAPTSTLAVAAGELGLRELLLAGSGWRVLDGGATPPAMWMLSHHDDSAWRFGYARFGFGRADLATTVSFGPDPANKAVTTFFRGRFELPTLAGLRSPRVRIQAEDGGVVHLNGYEVGRWNMPGGTVSPATRAVADVTGAARNAWRELPVPWSLLRTGTNVLAVEVHLAAPASSSLGFDLRLIDLEPPGSAGALWRAYR